MEDTTDMGTPGAPSDEELMARVLRRDQAAFEALLVRHREMVRRGALRIVRDGDAAEDLVQETFLLLWTRADRWDAGGGTLGSWLLRIATNLALNHLRRVRRRRERPLEIPPNPLAEDDDRAPPAWMIDGAALGPDALLERTERQARFRRLVDDLPEEKRAVFRMACEAEMETREVAQALGIPEGTVKSRLHYARKQLAHRWQDDEEDEKKEQAS